MEASVSKPTLLVPSQSSEQKKPSQRTSTTPLHTQTSNLPQSRTGVPEDIKVPTATSSQASPSNRTNNKDKLSTSEIIGIVVGLTSLLVALLTLYYTRKSIKAKFKEGMHVVQRRNAPTVTAT